MNMDYHNANTALKTLIMNTQAKNNVQNVKLIIMLNIKVKYNAILVIGHAKYNF